MSQVGNPQKISKNQRASGPKAQQAAAPLCARGHEQTRVLVVPVRGRRGMRWWCPCSAGDTA